MTARGLALQQVVTRHPGCEARHAATFRLTDDLSFKGEALVDGFAAVERRLAAFDGTMVVSSPPGGPTVVTMELPCVLSSPKTTPSSGTG